MIVMPSADSSRRTANSRLRLALVERGVGLVEDEHARPFDEHPAQLDQLALGDAKVADGGVRVDGESQARQRRCRATAHLGPVHETEPGRLPIGEQVGQDRPLRKEAQLLVDDADPEPAGIRRRTELDRLAGDADLAVVRVDRAGEDLHQGGLPGTVLADDGVHGAGLDGEVHAHEGLDPAVRLAQIGDGDRRESTPVTDPLVIGRGLLATRSRWARRWSASSAMTPSTSGW